MNNFIVVADKVYHTNPKLKFQYDKNGDNNFNLVTKELTSKQLYKILNSNDCEICLIIWNNEFYKFTAEFEPYYWERGQNRGQIKGYETIIKLGEKEF